MKIEAHGSNIILKEIYCGVLLETSEGNAIGICMRDDTFEINVLPKNETQNNWYRVNMQENSIEKQGRAPTEDVGPTEGQEVGQ